MILIGALISLSLGRCTPWIWIIGWLLTYSFMINYVSSPTAVARYLFGSSPNISTLRWHWLPLSLDLIEALLTVFLIYVFNSLYNRVFICYHAFSQHWRWGVCVVRILASDKLFVFFRVYLSLILVLHYSTVNEMASICSLVHSETNSCPSTYGCIGSWCTNTQLIRSNDGVAWTRR